MSLVMQRKVTAQKVRDRDNVVSANGTCSPGMASASSVHTADGPRSLSPLVPHYEDDEAQKEEQGLDNSYHAGHQHHLYPGS